MGGLFICPQCLRDIGEWLDIGHETECPYCEEIIEYEYEEEV